MLKVLKCLASDTDHPEHSPVGSPKNRGHVRSGQLIRNSGRHKMLENVARLEDDDIWDAFGNHLCTCREELSSSFLKHFIFVCPIPSQKRWARKELLLALERERQEAHHDRASALTVIQGMSGVVSDSAHSRNHGTNDKVLVRDQNKRQSVNR